jgi:hypothetical protein
LQLGLYATWFEGTKYNLLAEELHPLGAKLLPRHFDKSFLFIVQYITKVKNADFIKTNKTKLMEIFL